MKAVRIHGHGGPEALVWEDAPRPVPGPGEILVRVAAAGVNPADYKHRNGMFRDFVPYVFPKILGYDVAGTVEAHGRDAGGPEIEGPDSGRPAPGTRVFAMLDPLTAGGYAQYVAVPAHFCAVIPEGMDFATAAALPCPALTGTQMVEEILRPAMGETVLVTGATGMVGRFAILAVRNAGARAIAAVRPAYADEARVLGADGVAALGGPAWDGPPFDGMIDTVGGRAASALASAVKSGGRILCAATDPLDPALLPVVPEFIAVHPDGSGLGRIAAAVMAGKVDVPIVARIAMAEAQRAHEAIEGGSVRGKIVLMADGG